MSEIRGPEKISMLLSIAIVENVVLNLSHSNSFTSKIWKSTLRTGELRNKSTAGVREYTMWLPL